jgi:hypothetical protein
VIKRRFTETQAEAMLQIAWWDWPHDKLRSALADIRRLPIEAFIETYRPGAAVPPTREIAIL